MGFVPCSIDELFVISSTLHYLDYYSFIVILEIRIILPSDFVLTILGLLHLHFNFKISLLTSIKSFAGILTLH